jgi:hypothetical protein
MKPLFAVRRFLLAISAVSLLVLPSVAVGQTVLLNDTFTGGTVNVANWQVLLPSGVGTSIVSQAGGLATLTNRGTLLSQSSFANDITISGTFTLNAGSVGGYNEAFQIVARSDGNIPAGNVWAERTGIHFYVTTDQIDILKYNADGTDANLIQTFYTFNVGQAYDFVASLNGSALSFSITGGPTLTATDGYSAGGLVALYGREANNVSTSLDSITISSIPEPSTYAAILGMLALVGVTIQRRRQKSAA